MKVCLKCKKEHEKQGIYCSRTCANSRVFSESAKRKKSIANKKHWQENRKERLITAVKNANAQKKYNKQNKKILEEQKYKRAVKREWIDLGYDLKRWVIIYEQQNKCAHCNINKWQGQLLTLEIDHIDGNRYNDVRDNLEALCPNCHSLTETWRGKHRKGKVGYTEQELYDAYMKAGNVRQTLKALKLNNSRGARERILRAVESIGS